VITALPDRPRYRFSRPARPFGVLVLVVVASAWWWLVGEHLRRGETLGLMGSAGSAVAILVALAAMAEVARGGRYSLVIDGDGLRWCTPDAGLRQVGFAEVSGYRIHRHPASEARIDHVELVLHDGTVQLIPSACIGDEPLLEAALAAVLARLDA
jgi:hypothetical protein